MKSNPCKEEEEKIDLNSEVIISYHEHESSTVVLIITQQSEQSQQESAAYILVSNGNGRIVNDLDLWPRRRVHAGGAALSGERHRAVVVLIWRRWWRLWWPHARRIGHCAQIVSVVGLYGRLLCAHRRLIECR